MRNFLHITVLALFLGCGSDGRVPVVQRSAPTSEQLIQENRDAIKLEDRDIDLYLARFGIEAQRSPRGIRYKILRDEPGDIVRSGQLAVVNYRVELLNGDTAYSTEPGRPESFKVEMDDVESGLHEAIQFLSPGDSAVIIIPSYRAHGLIGDMDRIPMRSSVVYRLGLVKVSGVVR
ncbi:MAG: FKBP-type peptidyl-prolyl cis-trans isomerase [Flavobacteriales bacterium]